MIYLKKLDQNNFEDNKLLFSFISNNNPSWKHSYPLQLAFYKKQIPSQENITDFEYFLLLNRILYTKKFLPHENYVLFDDLTPITHVYVIARSANIIDIGFATNEKYRRKGYATKALSLTEKMLFQNNDIIFTTITDVSVDRISSKIAKKAGYTFDKKHGYFIKINPNKNIEEYSEKQKIILNHQ